MIAQWLKRSSIFFFFARHKSESRVQTGKTKKWHFRLELLPYLLTRWILISLLHCLNADPSHNYHPALNTSCILRNDYYSLLQLVGFACLYMMMHLLHDQTPIINLHIIRPVTRSKPHCNNKYFHIINQHAPPLPPFH
jgi:hypothetical protein